MGGADRRKREGRPAFIRNTQLHATLGVVEARTVRHAETRKEQASACSVRCRI